MVRPREAGTPDYYNCGSYVGVFIDYNKEKYWGKFFWYDDPKKDVEIRDFDRNDMFNMIEELFG